MTVYRHVRLGKGALTHLQDPKKLTRTMCSKGGYFVFGNGTRPCSACDSALEEREPESEFMSAGEENNMEIERAIELAKEWVGDGQCTWFDDSYKGGYFRANAISKVEIELVESLRNLEWEINTKFTYTVGEAVQAFIDKVEKRQAEREKIRKYWQEEYEKEKP